MTTAATSLLGLALPVQGELSGTWGDTVNNSITNLLDAAVAGTTTLSADADVTLTTTTLAANQAREAIILWTAGGTATRYITAPAQSKAYVVINKTSSTQSIVIRGVGPTTGITIPAGSSRVVAWNGVDFVATAVDAASISGLGTGVATFLATPSSANLAAAVTDETGTGALVFANSPTLVTPALGTPASGVVTNLTGTASININGTVGATTPAAGSFTNITGSANAVISVTDNTNAALRITQLGTGNALLVEDSANPDSTPFVIDALGNVASGLTSTTLAMEIYRTSTASFRIDGDGVSSTIQARSFSDSADTGPILNYARGRGTKAVTTIVQSGDLLAQYRGAGWDGVQIIQAANIEVRVDGTPGTSDMPGRLVFSTTASGASTPTERMRINSTGNVGIGGTPSAGQTLLVVKAITGATVSAAVNATATISSDVTLLGRGYVSSLATQAAAFTLTGLEHFRANQSTIGAGSTVTNQYGFIVDNSFTGATNNYGFFSNIAAGTNRYNIYVQGTADNYFAGKVGIGTPPLSSESLRVSPTANAVATVYGIRELTTVDQATTTTAFGVSSQTNIVSPAAVTSLYRFYASQNTFTGTLTNQYGFVAENALIGATNNYGFVSSIPAAANRYNIYALGTADNYFAGKVGIGALPSTGASVNITNNITGATATSSLIANGAVQSDVTVQANYFNTSVSTQATAFTLTDLRHYNSAQATIGAGSTVTNQYGFAAQSNITGATNNYGFYSNIASGTNRYNFYANGTADNYFAGSMGIGAVPTSAAKANITSTSAGASTIALSLQNASNTINSETVLDFVTNNNGTGVRSAQITAINTNGGSGVNMLFKIGNGAVASEAMRLDSVGNFIVSRGAVVVYQPAPAGISAAATLTNADIRSQIINTTGTTYTVTMPLGTTLETLIAWTTTDVGYDFTVINTASGTITMAVNTGVTSLGSLTIATATSAQFRIRRTAASTFILYRLA